MVSIYRAAQTWEKIGDNANSRNGEVEVAFASQKKTISQYRFLDRGENFSCY